MQSKKSNLYIYLLFGTPILAIGLYFIIWSIYNSIFDEYFSMGIWFVFFGCALILGGFISRKNFVKSLKCHLHPDRESVGKCNYCFKSFCTECLTEIHRGKYYCPQCKDYALEQITQEQEEDEKIDISQIPLKSKTIALLLCLFLWLFGLHMFYLGYSSKGTARLIITLIAFGSLITPFGDIVLTITLFFKAIHAIIDLFSIAGNMRDAYGRKLV